MKPSIFFIFLSCFPDYKGKYQELFEDTKNLRVRCRNNKLSNAMIYGADSLFTMAKNLFEEKKYEKCYKALDRAYIYYTYSLENDILTKSQRRIDTLNYSIEKILEEYSGYEKLNRNP